MHKFVQQFSRQIVAGTLIFSLIVPNIASAQLAVTAPILEGQTILDYIQRALKVVFRNVVVVGAVQVSQKVAKEAAEGVANWVWEGGSGKSPLAFLANTGDYVKAQSEKALGDTLDQMSEDFKNADLLCIADPAAALGVLGGLYGALNKVANTPPFKNGSSAYKNGQNGEFLATGSLGKCDAGSVIVNYKNLTNDLSPDQLLKRFSTAATSGGSEIDQIVASQMQAMSALVREQKAAELERLASKSYKNQTAPISGAVTQPSEAVAEDAKLNTAKFQAEQEQRQLSGILASGAEAIPAIFATTFANALSKKLIDKLKRGQGTLPSNKTGNGSGVNLANVFGAGKTNGNSAATSLYSDVKTVTISEGGLDLLTSFVACPDKFAAPDNCVMDEAFASAVRAADSGKGMTVKEAIEQGKLDPKKEMVPPSQTAKNEDRLCAKTAYCTSNLSKLRKARVIPIGWEIAAASADGTGKTTLGDVVKGFNDCKYNEKTGVAERDATHPFCHLIDPNWVLKMPQHICKAKVFGPQLQSELGPNRQEVCSDQVSCLQEDANGQCTGAFGYCLREKNTFRFDAEECPAQFAGCRNYQNTTYGAISLVDATIDAGTCTDKNTGCRGYFVDFLPTGVFDTSANAQKVYLNAKAASCSAQNIGCTQVQDLAGQSKFLRLPPAGLGCKGLDSDPTACNQYAKACGVEEVGCDLYQPIGSSDDAVPGVATMATRDVNGAVVAWNDECAKECVGYTSFYQAPTQTEPIAAAAAAFIPASAKSCTQEVVGCEAYQNIDSAAKGGGTVGYFANVQKCSDPAVEKNHAVFYSWEGSDQSGYQLHQHDLVTTANDGAPKYDIANPALLAVAIAECTPEKYKARIVNGKPDPFFNVDCRELFDQSGKPFYRLISKTIVSTPACVAFRKDSSDAANCAGSNGKFDATNGSCEYGFLPSGSTQCKPQEVGCRAYNGSAALSPKIILNESFDALGTWAGGQISKEGITVGDTVLKLTDATADHQISLVQNKTYNVVFWAKGQGTFNLKFASATYVPSELMLNKDPLVAGPEWRRYEVSSPPTPWADTAAKLVFQKVASAGLYIENIKVKEQVAVVTVLRNSWTTPLSCDPVLGDGIAGPALNCQAYKPKNNSALPAAYLTGFTSLCRAPAAGCQKFVNTQNTPEITEKEFKFGTATRTVPGDEFTYVIANAGASCPADAQGCSALGLVVSAGKTETVTKINNPGNYQATACEVKDEWCSTFPGSGGTQRYFKYPDASKQCEYRENVEVKGAPRSGWFKSGSDEPCYDSFVAGGNFYGIYKNKDKNFTGMAGMCEPEFGQCTEFIDHADVSFDHPAGRSYFFMDDTHVDASSCNGKVSLKEGCVALDNTTLGNKTIATLATYCKSDATTNSLCAAILSAQYANVSAGDQQKDGALVTPAVGPTSLTQNPDTIKMCSRANTNGLFVATDCDAQLTKLKDALGADPAAQAAAASLKCDVQINQQLVAAFVALAHAGCGILPDANTIVKVRRDRTCGEWLACQGAVSVYDKATQKFKQVCTDLGVCNKLSSDSGAVGQCANWVTPQQLSSEENLQRSLPLTTARYVSRNVGWYGREFSGYSLWHKFQPDTIGRFSETPNGELKIGVGFANKNECVKNGQNVIGDKCTAAVFLPDAVQKSITAEFDDVSFEGKCFEQKCWYPIEGFVPKKNANAFAYTESSCRGYPEQDAPFPQSVVQDANMFGVVTDKVSGFDNANVCERFRLEKPTRSAESWSSFEVYKGIKGGDAPSVFVIKNSSCDCSYKKVEYGSMNEKHYFGLGEYAGTNPVGKSVLALFNVKGGGFRWYDATVTGFHDGVYDVKYGSDNDNKIDNGVSPQYVVFKDQTDAAPLQIGDKVIADFEAYNANAGDKKWYYEGAVTGTGDSYSVMFDAAFPFQVNGAPAGIPKKHFLKFQKDQLFAKKTLTSAVTAGVPKGLCGGGWFVIGSKLPFNGEAVVESKKGLSCSTDFDCIDERVVKLKNPISISQDGIDGKKDIEGYSYQYSSDDGKCEFKKKETTVYGWKGYCLEKDFSAHLNNTLDDYPCLTWLPIDVAGLDVYNQFFSAGYSVDPSGAGQFYCVQAQGRAHDDNVIGKMSYAYYANEPDGTGLNYLNVSASDYANSKITKSQAAGWAYAGGATAGTNGVGDNDQLTNDWAGFKDYKQAGLGDFNSKEIDYIDVIAKEGNKFFPKDYAMKITNDGKVRVYYNAGLTSADGVGSEGIKCPARAPMAGSKMGLYNFLDPNVLNQKFVLSTLSQQVRCGSNAGGSETCDHYSGSGSVDPYFVCSAGETSVKSEIQPFNTDDQAIAITGVARTGSINGTEYSEQLANGSLSQIWFVRVDNQAHYPASGNSGGKDTTYYGEFGDEFKLHDIVRGYNKVGPAKSHTDSIGYNACPSLEDYVDAGDNDYRIFESNTQKAYQVGYELRFVFGDNGKFLGIDAAHCTNAGKHTIEADWIVKVHMRNACLKVAQTTQGLQNAAATNRLWSTYPAGFKKATDDLTITDKGALKVGASGVVAPGQRFGSLALNETGLDQHALVYSYLEMTDGTSDGFKTAFSTGAQAYSCENGSCLGKADGKAFKPSLFDGVTALQNLFGRIYNVYKTNVGYLAKYAVGTESDLGPGNKLDVTAKGAQQWPVVFAFDPTTCTGARGGSCTLARKYGMTINGAFADGAVVFGKGSVAATMQFYGYADQNQMPLKRVKVEWGDGSNVKKEGTYRNHKPVCSDQKAPVAVCKFGDAVDYNHVCVSNKDCVDAKGVVAGTCETDPGGLKWSFGSWGGNGSTDEGACEPNFFQFTHAYVFTPNCALNVGDSGKAVVADAASITQYKLEGKVGIGERFCVFKPRVQLLDNWGACNGVVSKTDSAATGYGGVSKNYDFCDLTSDPFDHTLFTPYQGYIIVKE